MQVPASPSVSPHLPPIGTSAPAAAPPLSSLDIVGNSGLPSEGAELALSAKRTSADPDDGLKPGPNDNLLLTPPSSDRTQPRELSAAIAHALADAPLRLPLSAISVSTSPSYSGGIHHDEEGTVMTVTKTRLASTRENLKGDSDRRQRLAHPEEGQGQGQTPPLENIQTLPPVDAHSQVSEESCHEVAASLVLLRTRGGPITTTSQETSAAARLNAGAVAVAVATPPQTPGGLLGLKVTPVPLSATGRASASVSQ